MKKLVRDKIPAIIKAQGRIPNIETIKNDEEYYKFLTDKLYEEIEELLLASSREEKIEEMADVFEVLDAICEFNKIDKSSVLSCKNRKFDERGSFKDRIILIKD